VTSASATKLVVIPALPADSCGAAIEVCRNATGPRRAGGADAQWLSWTQAESYCETAAVLFALANDAVPGLPAYTTPAWPLGLNGEPGAVTEDPSVTGFGGVRIGPAPRPGRGSQVLLVDPVFCHPVPGQADRLVLVKTRSCLHSHGPQPGIDRVVSWRDDLVARFAVSL
jgi:hypothetical protein